MSSDPPRSTWYVLVFTAFVAVALVISASPAVLQEESGSRVVSADPLIDTASSSGGMRLENSTVGPWTVSGRWGPADGPNGTGGIVLHPWPVDDPASAKPSAVRQTVEIPEAEQVWAVLRARNAADHLDAAYSDCADSSVELQVTPQDGPGLSKHRIVGAEEDTIRIDISRFAGETVDLAALARPGGAGCGRWNGEFTLVSALYIATGNLSDVTPRSSPARANETSLDFYAAPQNGTYPEPDHPPRFYRSIDRPPGQDLKQDYCQKHDGWSRTVIPTVQVCTNSDGFRDREYTVETPDDTYRIIALGDAVTFGTGVNNSETWPNVLERTLNSEPWIDDMPYEQVEVLNFGFPAWNTKREVQIFSWKGVKYEPDLVILQYMENDAQNLSRVDELRARYLEQLQEEGVDSHRAEVLAGRTAFREERKERRQMPVAEEMAFVERYLDRLDALGEEHGFDVLFMHYSTSFSERHLDYLRERIPARYGWAFMESDLGELSDYTEEDYLLAQDDFYLNALGYELTAEQVADRLAEDRELMRR